MSKKGSTSFKVSTVWLQIALVVIGILVLMYSVNFKTTIYTVQDIALAIVYVLLGRAILGRTKNVILSLILMGLLGVLFFVFILIT